MKYTACVYGGFILNVEIPFLSCCPRIHMLLWEVCKSFHASCHPNVLERRNGDLLSRIPSTSIQSCPALPSLYKSSRQSVLPIESTLAQRTGQEEGL